MITTSFILLSVAFMLTSCAEENCDNLGVLLYEDLNCKPVVKEGQKCPMKFDCGDLTMKEKECNFKGRKLQFGEQLDRNLTYEACHVGCYCAEPNLPIQSKANIRCAVLDCPEWLGVRPTPGCYPKYELKGCCQNGEICPPFDDKAKCEYDGKTYKEGEKFSSNDKCFNCVCQKGFSGKMEEPHCSRPNCGVQIRNAEKLASNCAPIYGKPGDLACCPDYDWVCHEASDKIIKISNKPNTDDLKCNFGSAEVQLGHGVEKTIDAISGKKNVKCECIIPPFLTCRHTG